MVLEADGRQPIEGLCTALLHLEEVQLCLVDSQCMNTIQYASHPDICFSFERGNVNGA